MSSRADRFLAFARAARSLGGRGACWNLACTTCGATDLRRGLWATALGSDFSRLREDEVPVESWRRHCDRTLGPVQPIRPTPPGVSILIGEACAPAPLNHLAEIVGFPDWLGYLGIVLAEVERDDSAARRLTDAWIPQLIGLGGHPETWEPFVGARPLRWSDLEQAEFERVGRSQRCP